MQLVVPQTLLVISVSLAFMTCRPTQLSEVGFTSKIV